jgi:hypothetical protein
MDSSRSQKRWELITINQSLSPGYCAASLTKLAVIVPPRAIVVRFSLRVGGAISLCVRNFQGGTPLERLLRFSLLFLEKGIL